MQILVVVEHDGARVRAGSRNAAGAALDLASQTGGRVELLVLGDSLDQVASDAATLAPVVVADHPTLSQPTADRYAHLIAAVARTRHADIVLAASTTFARDILPRAAALLDGAMASDVTACWLEGGRLLLQRPVYAGAATATLTLEGSPAVITVRASSFRPPAPALPPHPVEHWAVDPAALPGQIEFLSREACASDRPELTEARIVISGGRVFRDRGEYEAHVGRLADVLGGAVGCTRALVDAGVMPNDSQVGQTGKVVSPELYVALGISGAVQHLAGMKGSRVVVAVNIDPEAPMFSAANYGLVGDVRQIVPELIERLAPRS